MDLTRYRFQALATVACVLLGLCMIVNNQMGGEAMWFWYATVFHRGAHLYSGLHSALQPLFVLMTDAWMILFGHRLIVTQIPSLLEICAMCLGILLLLRESDWPDWQKALALLGTFALTVSGHSYRFDDYHVLAENLILYTALALVVLARTSDGRRQLLLATIVGILSGLAITSRLTDGVALLVSAAVSAGVILRERRVICLEAMIAAAALTVILVVACTGDSLPVYLVSTIFHAAGSKGGTGSILAAPFAVVRNTLPLLFHTGKQVVVVLLAIGAASAIAERLRKPRLLSLFGLQVALATAVFLVIPHGKRTALENGLIISVSVLCMIFILYFVAAFVMARIVLLRGEARELARPQVLVLIPLAEWASYSAGAAAEPLTNYYAPMALLLLLAVVIKPLHPWRDWAKSSLLFLFALLAISTFTSKATTPYSWQNYRVGPMFQDRARYDHPVYGPMYVDRALLAFSLKFCGDIHASPNPGKPELLSLPYPYPNYFCDIPPWHDYVQTFFDTSTRATIEQLMKELATAPPQWIIYQRQLNILQGAERLYNHGNPLAQRDLDTMIASKLSSGQWKLVDYSNYLGQEGGWFLIETHP